MQSLPHDFRVLIRLHIHGTNGDSIIDLINDLVLTFGNDTRFMFNIQKILKYFPDHSPKQPLADDDAVRRIQSHAKATIPSTQLVNGSDLLSCCYASMPNHFVIAADGKVQKC